MSRSGKNLKNVLLWVVGLAAAAVAAWQFYLFASFRDARGAFDAQGGTYHLWLALGATLAACALGFLAFSVLVGHDEKDELHITT